MYEGSNDDNYRRCGRFTRRQACAEEQRRRVSPSTLRNTISGLLFVSPWLIGLLVFALYPILASAYFSLTSYNIVKAPEFIGLQNYRDLSWTSTFLNPWATRFTTRCSTSRQAPSSACAWHCS